jgi:nicotinamide phosphoribosyltransferase
MAAFSVPAAEHSTITSWGRERETDAFRNMIAQFGKPGAIVSVVSDSYDLFAALDAWGTQLKQAVLDSGGMLVIRPDSGDPRTIVLQTLQALEASFGSVVNGKRRRVLNNVRVIQGDGVNPDSIETILAAMDEAGFAADNIVFGMGGALLQQINRDTQRFAMKCSAIRLGDAWHDVRKDPVTDAGKRSMKGRLTLLVNRHTGEYRTTTLPVVWDERTVEGDWEEALVTVFDSGKLLVDTSLAEIRRRAHAHEG